MKYRMAFLLSVVLLLGGSISPLAIAQEPTPTEEPAPVEEPTTDEPAVIEEQPAVEEQPAAEPAPTGQPGTLEEITVINSVEYTCRDRKGFTADYLSDDSVVATFGTQEIILPRVSAASGARYSNGSVTVNTKGNSAFVQVGDRTLFEDCVAKGTQPVQALW